MERLTLSTVWGAIHVRLICVAQCIQGVDQFIIFKGKASRIARVARLERI